MFLFYHFPTLCYFVLSTFIYVCRNYMCLNFQSIKMELILTPTGGDTSRRNYKIKQEMTCKYK